MKLFISWSGPVSQQIAEVLHWWLKLILPSVKPFITTSDLDKGARWQTKIAGELEESNYGLACLTADSLDSQWLAFEAGALSKHLDGRVATVLFGGITASDVRYPLGMFQATVFEREDVRRLIGHIDGAVEEQHQRGAAQLDAVFPKFWPELKQQIEGILKDAAAAGAAAPPAPDTVAMMQEMMAMLRALLSEQRRLVSASEVLQLFEAGERTKSLIRRRGDPEDLGVFVLSKVAQDVLFRDVKKGSETPAAAPEAQTPSKSSEES
jgi:hypothetical protein